MMTRIFLFLPALWLIFLFSFASPVAAQDSVDTKGSAETAAPVALNASDKQQLQSLVSTLENETSRAAFLSNLKTLLSQSPVVESGAEASSASASTPVLDAPITEAIGVRDQVEGAVSSYEKFLEKHNLSSSIVHQIAGTLITLILGLGIYMAIRTITFHILKRINALAETIGLRLTRFGFYTMVIQGFLKALVIGLTIYTLGKIWSIHMIDSIFESESMRSFIGMAVTILLVGILSALVWDAIGLYLSYMLKQADDRNQTRVKTLLPIVRNIILSVFAVLFGLVLMSEIGINVTPLLAGAGVIGVAIGFGAQTMVKDFLTGFTIVLEDLVRVGDVVALGGCNGVVEKITLRKVQLRDVAGIVYTIPFSEITTIQNMTKDFSFYVMDISVAYKENTDRVIDVLRQVDEDLRQDPNFGGHILDQLEVLGVDRFMESAVIIKARIKTVPMKQWMVGREYNRRMKLAFDREGIEIPFPQRTVTVVSAQPLPDVEKAAIPG